jgi:signal transduction histidine kinase
VQGFSQRSSIRVGLVAQGDLGRLPAEVERTLFRVIQECLANVHRHAGSSTARIELKRSASAVHLRVADAGRGLGDVMPPKTHEPVNNVNALGVGIPGMRQRLRQLGGRLVIRSTQQGTTVTATGPIQGEALRDARTTL